MLGAYLGADCTVDTNNAYISHYFLKWKTEKNK